VANEDIVDKGKDMEKKKCPFCGEEILAEAKKCKHCGEWLEEKTDAKAAIISDNQVKEDGEITNTNIENVSIKTPDLNIWKKIALIYPLAKRWILDEFILKDKILTIKCKDGNVLQAPLNECTATFETNKDDFTWITVKSKDKKIRFGEYAFTISDEEWQQIWMILNPSESTLSKFAGIVQKIINIVKDPFSVVSVFNKKNAQTSSASGKKSKRYVIWTIVLVIFATLCGIYSYTDWLDEPIDKLFSSNENAENIETVNSTETNESLDSNLITPSSIAGVKIIGMTPQKIKPYINEALTWEHIEGDEETDSPEEYIIKRGNNVLFSLYMEENKRVYAMYIYDTSLKTKEGLHVGSTAGDLLKVFPNATVRNAEFGEYTSINDIIYVFDSDYENYVGTYNDNDVSKIVNRNIKIGCIIIGDI
jgi:uncharacterized OB-fold protein